MTDYLLPSGLKDVLPPDAERQYRLLDRLLQRFFLFGYQLVMPPLLEFEETMLAGKAKALETQTFRFMDPVSRKMLALRADMTVQVTRIAASRLLKDPMPLRLCYTGNVMRTQADKLSSERQLPQAGIELIGSDSATADVEVISALTESLDSAGIKGIIVDLSLSGLLPLIAGNLSSEDESALQSAIQQKNAMLLPAHLANRALFESLLGLFGPATETLPKLLALDLPESLKPMLSKLEQIIKMLSPLRSITLTLDPLEASSYSYHEGVSFSLFLASNRQEIGRGGRYVIERTDGEKVPATGGTLYLSRLIDQVAPGPSPTRLKVKVGGNYGETRVERENGMITIHELEN